MYLTHDGDVERSVSVDHPRVDVETTRLVGDHNAAETLAARSSLTSVNHWHRERASCKYVSNVSKRIYTRHRCNQGVQRVQVQPPGRQKISRHFLM